MFNTITKEFQYGNQQVTLETGRIARQYQFGVGAHGRRECVGCGGGKR